MCPDGARVIIDVGAAAPVPEAVWLLAEHEHRLQLDVHGTAHAVRGWVEARRAGSATAVLL
jgi:hypothetical protein